MNICVDIDETICYYAAKRVEEQKSNESYIRNLKPYNRLKR